uniref:Lipocalin/cytosolic fatty-acid binding domain-containing protein n=1 Tax=Rhizochromulina marina TaxID=1034831 RepID=A0A7S2WCU6_9STRA|mmetsp:Transcript_20321/g.59366  ORF Transcript_20321/g.59366 Transcript_20321/m.59366 type:complete len:542 (+) Transcript_20321:79-1704(+)
MASFGQFAATSQFYLYGRRHCTQTGYLSARKKYEQPDILADPSLDLTGKVCMVTGANSGVGREVTQFLVTKGATVYMVCRSRDRAEAVRQEILAASEGRGGAELLVCDCSLEADIRRCWESFAAAQPRLDVLVCNAGVLLNDRTLTSEGVEVTFATHLLFGTFLLGSLAMPRLVESRGRLVIVSSGGMYNTKFPGMDIAGSLKGSYNGNLAYAYAKRGQVLLAEEWTKQFPEVKVVSCHPGWTATPAVDAAYGENRKYLEPMRTPWEGAEGISWLCVAPEDKIESGGFYLDRSPRAKHMSGAFFSEGSFTKNTREEVDAMMHGLQRWTSAQRPAAPTDEELASRNVAIRAPLEEATTPIETEKFMGRWFVVANIPTYFEQGMVDCIEDYVWNPKTKRIEVRFTMRNAKSGATTELLQRAKVTNTTTNTRWSIQPKFGVFLPLNLSYIIAYCSPDYSTTIIGVPNRDYLWIMSRKPSLPDQELDELIDMASRNGYDPTKIAKVAQGVFETLPEAPADEMGAEDAIPPQAPEADERAAAEEGS